MFSQGERRVGSGENSCRAKIAEEKNHARGTMEKIKQVLSSVIILFLMLKLSCPPKSPDGW